MGLFESANPEVRTLRGLHLYHFAVSNCSQRVRMALEEKGLDWTSHHVNLPANEHATDWYQSIHPNGVVPTLVHDGQVIIESNDIIQYLEERFPEPPLSPADPQERSMERCASIS
jgi:glutathione S-transferase